jgi:hypothetical protein
MKARRREDGRRRNSRWPGVRCVVWLLLTTHYALFVTHQAGDGKVSDSCPDHYTRFDGLMEAWESEHNKRK